MVYIGINFGAAVNEMFMGYIKKLPQVPVWIRRCIRYPPVEPSDMNARRYGSWDEERQQPTRVSEQYKAKLAGTKVSLEIVDGLDHPGEFEQIDRVFPREVEFTRANAR